MRIKVQAEISCGLCHKCDVWVDAILELESEIDRVPMNIASLDIQYPSGWIQDKYDWTRRICPECVSVQEEKNQMLNKKLKKRK